MVPVFAALALFYGDTAARGQPVELLRWLALGVFVFAAATDGVDGWVARRFNQCSKFGAFIDPIADKLLLLTGVVILSVVDWGSPGWHLPLWFAVLVALRDCLILIGIRILWNHDREVKFKAHWTGKVCTVTQMFALGWVMLRAMLLPPIYPCAIAAFFTLWSSIAYFCQAREILRG